jgi:hypothetical protein
VSAGLRQATAEHEAAHATVATALGLTVLEVRAGVGRGHTLYLERPNEVRTAAAIWAGDLWCKEFGSVPYEVIERGACADLARLERDFDPDRFWRGHRLAREILSQHRRAVVALAGRLVAEGDVTFGSSRPGAFQKGL